MNRIFKYIPIALVAAVLGACADKALWNEEEIGSGEAEISGALSFRSYASALDSRTGGTTLDELGSLTVLAYTADGSTLVSRQVFTTGGGGLDVQYTNTSAPTDAVKPNTSTPTGKGSFSMSLPYGRYKIYAVANADISGYSDADLSTDTRLKEISFTWQNDVAKNGQMFGWFTTNTPTAVSAEKKFDADVVTINRRDITLSAWLVRLASKVTVSFDASGLKENVFVYLKSVQIKDIPKTCTLGVSNTPAENEVEPNGEIAYYYDRQAMPDGPSLGDYNIETYPSVLTNGNPTLGSDHTHGADALFFYENDQGKGKDKAQDADKNGVIDFPDGNNGKPGDGFKDEKRAGTYIEVKAYYISRNTDRAGQGEITYRFMLGKDVATSYEALRNYHFKLTLMLKGYANDVDWHIEYEQEERKIIAPNPYYISYLYNHSMMLPLTIKTGNATITKIKAEIVSNNWAPMNADNGFSGNIITSSNDWQYFNSYYLYWKGVDNPVAYPWNGFLSLRKTEQTDITGTLPVTVNSNKSYYESANRGNVEYTDFSPTSESVSVSDALIDGKPHIALSKDGVDNTYVVNVPLWTRAKTLISQTGYTGNNPYVAHRRQAKVKFTVTLSDGTVMTTDNKEDYQNGENVEIQQVRCIVNPKGIYRAANETGSFDVDLKVLPDEESTSFVSLKSDGPWRAYVIRDTKRGEGNATGWNDANGTIRLEGGSETTAGTIDVKDRNGITRTYQTVEGKTGSSMQFKVVFNGTASASPNHAIIRVEYQNYTCYHLIFVRQGYDPDDIINGGAKWMTSNNVAFNQVAASPLDEGSMFKFGDWSQPIDASNNKNGKSPWTKVTPNDFIANVAGDNPLKLYPSGEAKWENINRKGTTTAANSFPDQTGMRVAEEVDYLALRNHEDVEQGFGVLYGDKSSRCLNDIEDVYGYDRTHTDRGMRGCFVYNYRTGKNMFLPIGASGYGHRKDEQTVNGTTYRGVLRYAASTRWGYFNAQKPESYPNGINDAPLFFDLFRRPGACYWYRVPAMHDGTNYPTWDINYFSFDFGTIPGGNVKNGDDALFVRSISTK